MNRPANPSSNRRGRRRHWPAILLLISLAAILAGGCLRHESRADLVIVNGAEPETLDPAIISGQPDMRVVIAIFEGLTRLDPKTSSPVPGLAEKWDISPDGCIYTFHLRTNLMWSTGEPITAEDVVYSWIRALKPETASDYAGQLFYLKNGEEFTAGKIKDPSLVGVRAMDAHTVRVELNHPTAFFLDLCSFCTLCIVPRQTIEKYGDRWLMARPLPVSGPFELVTWRINDKIRLRKNPHYWDVANTRSEIVDFLPINSAPTALNLYETHAADVVWDKFLVPGELLDVLLKRPDFHTSSILATYFIRFNVTRKPFDDPRVRRALALAVDKPRITRKITRAGEQAAATLVPPSTARYHPIEGLGYDPEQARKLLAEAGYPGGRGFPRLEYMIPTVKLHEQIGVELQQMWRDELGINIELHPVEWKVYLTSLSTLDYQFCYSSWVADYNDPDTFLGMFMTDNGNNRTGWTSKKYDELIRSADRENDPAQRVKFFQDAEAMLVRDELPIVPLYYFVGCCYYSTNIQGIYPSAIDMHPVNSIWKQPQPADNR